jgi:plastocyanin
MTPPRRSSRHALLGALAAGALLAGGPPVHAGDAVEVRISQHQFRPRVIAVSPGTTIRWVNDDDDPHTVTADAGPFASRGIDTHEEFSAKLAAPGTYAYHCALHPMMTGTVVVR